MHSLDKFSSAYYATKEWEIQNKQQMEKYGLFQLSQLRQNLYTSEGWETDASK